MVNRIVVAALLPLLLITASLRGQFVSYQGYVEFNGQTLADGEYDVVLTLWDAATDGNIRAIYNLTETINNGLLSVSIPVENDLLLDDERWLGIEIDGTLLSPRQRLDAAPFALTIGGQAFAVQDGLFAPNALRVSGHENNDGTRTLMAYGETLALEGGSTGDGYRLIRSLRSGNDWFEFQKTDGNSFFPDGGIAFSNVSPNGERRFGLQITGDERVIIGNIVDPVTTGSRRLYVKGGGEFEGGVTAGLIRVTEVPGSLRDESVQLPVAAINSIEMLDEPGVAQSSIQTSALTPITSVYDTLNSVTIDPPSNGFVLLIATAELEIEHREGFDTIILLGLSDAPDTFLPGQNLESRVENSLPTGNYDKTVTVHTVVPIGHSTRTYHLVGNMVSTLGGATARNTRITAAFFPTFYDPTVPLGHGSVHSDDDPDQVPARNLLSERNHTMRAALERQQRELEAMRERIKSLERHMDDSD